MDAARVKQYGTRIQTESRRLRDTVERVLLYAGIEAGHAAAHRMPQPVGTLISDAVAASQDTVAEAGVTVDVQVPEGLPPVLVDAPALRSCLANLIANAVKYGGTSRWIGVTASTAPGRKGPEVRVAVTDKGLGISSADLPHIFEPFYRGAEAHVPADSRQRPRPQHRQGHRRRPRRQGDACRAHRAKAARSCCTCRRIRAKARQSHKAPGTRHPSTAPSTPALSTRHHSTRNRNRNS